MDADITTSISEDICIAYLSNNGTDELTKKTTTQIFIEPTDSCPLCEHSYMSDEEMVRWCSFYDKACADVEECYQYEPDFPIEYIEDRYEGWIVKS